MKCNHCGQDIPDGSLYCIKCGEQAQPESFYEKRNQRLSAYWESYQRDQQEAEDTLLKAEKGDTEAQIERGNYLAYGLEDGEEKPKEAIQWYQKAADQGDPKAMILLADCLGKTNTVGQLLLVEKAMSLNFPPAFTKMGDLYIEGIEVDVNHEKALEMYKKAYDLGDPEGLGNVIFFYLNGDGVPHDLEKAKEIAREAAEAGSFLGETVTGMFCLRDDHAEEAVSWFKKAENGHFFRTNATAWSEFEEQYGICYLHGYGVEPDRNLALEKFMSGVQESVICQLYSGLLLEDRTIDPEPDYGQSFSYYLRALDEKDPIAKFVLGYHLENGLGTEIDLDMANGLYRDSAENGCVLAQWKMSELFQKGIGVEKDPETSAEWRRIAENGNLSLFEEDFMAVFPCDFVEQTKVDRESSNDLRNFKEEISKAMGSDCEVTSISQSDIQDGEIFNKITIKSSIGTEGAPRLVSEMANNGCRILRLEKSLTGVSVIECFENLRMEFKDKGFVPVILNKEEDLQDYSDIFDIPFDDGYYKALIKKLDFASRSVSDDRWSKITLTKYFMKGIADTSIVQEKLTALNPLSDEEFADIKKQYMNEPNVLDDDSDLRISVDDIIALIPAREEDVMEWIPFGLFNDCPSPENHVAFSRMLFQKYGAFVLKVWDGAIYYYFPTPIVQKEAIDDLSAELLQRDEENFGDMKDTEEKLFGKKVLKLSWLRFEEGGSFLWNKAQ